MLDLGAYLLGIVALALLATSAWLGGTAARRRLLPDFDGAPAHLATSVLALALVIWPLSSWELSAYSNRSHIWRPLR